MELLTGSKPRGGDGVYNHDMRKRVIHISEKEATNSDVATLLTHARAGVEIVIEAKRSPLPCFYLPNPCGVRFPSALHCCPQTRLQLWIPISPKM